jgi:hypothetical protein
MRSLKDILSLKGGAFDDFTDQIRLILRLVADPRVNPLLKLLPIGSVIYFLIPDIMPGPIDDALIAFITNVLFLELCPSHVVEEHTNSIKRSNPNYPDDDDVIDVEFRNIN